MFAERESQAVFLLQEQDMTRFDAVNYITHGIAKAPGRSETRRVQEKAERTEGVRFPIFNTRETSAVDETKLTAAILCARMILPDDVAADPVATTVDLYERIVAELRARARGHGVS